MDVRSGFIDSIGNTPLIRLRRASEATGCNILGKAEFMNPGRFGEGSRRPRHHRGRREARRAQARRHHRRGHRRQHRHRPHAGRQRARLPLGHRDAGDAEQGEEGLAAPVRRRPAPGAGQAVSRSRQLRARTPALAGWRRSRTARSGPTSSTTWPTARATRTHRAGDLGADRRPGRRVHLRRRHRRHAGRRGARAEAAQSDVGSRSADPRARAVQLGASTASSRSRAIRSPRASARPASPPTSMARRSTMPNASPTRRRWRVIFDLIARRAVARQLVRHQHRRADAAGEASSARATRW